jgi:hypothetical protein
VSWLDVTTQSDFKRARRKAFLAGLLDMVLRRPGNLIPFDEVRQRLNIRGQRYLGHRIVPVNKIVGSEGRYADFDRRFLPRRDETQRRWRSIEPTSTGASCRAATKRSAAGAVSTAPYAATWCSHLSSCISWTTSTL